MDPINHQGGFGEGFVFALACAAALRVAKPMPDLDGIDWCMWPDRVGAAGGARFTPINVQVKSSSAATETAGTWGYRLDVAHFNVLADAEIMAFPTYLFLVIVPGDWRHYMRAHADGMMLQHAAYWHSLAGEDPIVGAAQGAKTTVHVPKDNLLTVDSLRTLVGTPPLAAPEAQKGRAS